MPDESDQPAKFPWYVRALAVAYVLSTVAGPMGFVLLGSLAGILWVRQGSVDHLVVECGVLAIACPAVCALFRHWFRAWGRSNWPDGKPTGE